MHLNPDCCRDILLAVEDKPLGEFFTINTLFKQINNYPDDEVYYACLKLNEAGFLDISTVGVLHHTQTPRISTIDELTYTGHEFLDNIRSKSTWEKTKKIASSVGSFSLKTLMSISSNLITELIKSHF